MNTGSAFAAIVSPLVAGFVIDATGNWYLPFLMSMGLLLLGGFSRLPDASGAPVYGGRGAPAGRKGGGRGVGAAEARRLCMGGVLRRGDKPVKWCYSAAHQNQG